MDIISMTDLIITNGVLGWVCLLYTSDAADDLTRVDLGGGGDMQTTINRTYIDT